MEEKYGLLADVDRCICCHSCEVACNQANRLPPEVTWIHVFTIGPIKVDSKMVMEFVPLAMDDCNLCRNRIEQGLEPFCASICPTKALKYCNETEALKALRRRKRYQICRAFI